VTNEQKNPKSDSTLKGKFFLLPLPYACYWGGALEQT